MTAREYVWNHSEKIGEHYESWGYSREGYVPDYGMSRDSIFTMLNMIKEGKLTLD